METADVDRVLVDVDGTVCRHLPRVCEFLAREYGVDISPAEITDWRYEFEEIDTRVDEVIARLMTDHPRWFLSGLEPVAGARRALAALGDAEYERWVVTHRPAHTHGLTRNWLDSHDIGYDQFVSDVPANKAEVPGDALVDDYHANVNDAVEAGIVGVLFERPYSKPVEHPRATGVSTWSGVLGALGVDC